MAVKPPRPKGPALNALRAFEAAARHQSFALAADELSVTPGAISQHVKTLEDWAGQPLFQRAPNGVSLTPAAQRLVLLLEAAFDQLGAATRLLRSMGTQRELSIATLPSLAQLWLPKVLTGVRAALPGVSIRVTGLETPPMLRRELFDLAIFYEDHANAQGQVILHDQIFPVCAPEVAQQITCLEDLPDVPVLSDLTWDQDWPVWCAAQGLDFAVFANHSRYSLYALALQEARAGAGVLMGHSGLVEEDLAQGRLLRLPFPAIHTGRVLTLGLADGDDPVLADLIKFFIPPP
jgi:LysR family glycine cleavage system transcriptional activator